MSSGTAWSDEDRRLALRLRRRGVKNFKILEYFPGRTKGSLEGMFKRAGYVQTKKTVGTLSFEVPVDVWGDRDRRINEYRTRAQELLGDPPPSQSALGRPCE